jgi:hypothetical protein
MGIDAHMPRTPTPILRPTGLWVVAYEGPPAGDRSRPDKLKKVVDGWGRRTSRPDKATLLKQYELIRGEVTTSLDLQQQILGFGIATIGLLAGAAFVSKADAFRSHLLVVFLPLICYLAVTIWFSEVMRMLRAGGFLMTLEKKLDVHGDGGLEWEYGVAKCRLRSAHGNPLFARDPDRLRLVAVTTLFFTLGGESIMLGWDHASVFARTFAVAAGVVALIVLRRTFRLHVGEWNDLLDVRAEARGVPPEARVIQGCRNLLTTARLLSVPVPRRRPAATRDRRPPRPVAGASPSM